jgi:hypothetical protein
MVIFGWRRSTKRLGVVALPCGNCSSGQLVLHRMTRWFTVFFIPVIPVRVRHVTVCPNCKALRDVPRDELEHVKSLLPATS